MKDTDNKDVMISKPIVMILLAGGYTATEDFYNSVFRQVEEMLPAVVPEVSYTLEMLCGPEFWGQLDRNEQTLAGRCMVRMVKNCELPFEFVGCPHANPKKYRLKK